MRPSTREIDKRLTEAIAALEKGNLLFPMPAKAHGELSKFEDFDILELLCELIREITTDNYSGSRPPLKSYEPEIADCELWAFSWHSTHLKKRMYLKFALKDGYFNYVSLHEDRGHEMPKM